MREQEILDLLDRIGAVITDSHIVYTSGRHGTAYVNKDAIYPHTKETSRLCCEIAEAFRNYHVQTVIAPAVGGIKLSDRVAEHLYQLTGRKVLSIYAEKEVVPIPDPEGHGRSCFAETGRFFIRHVYTKCVSKRNVLVVEDILTTGGSAKKVVDAVRDLDGYVVGVGVLCNRGNLTKQDVGDVHKLVSLVNIPLDSLSARRNVAEAGHVLGEFPSIQQLARAASSLPASSADPTSALFCLLFFSAVARISLVLLLQGGSNVRRAL